MNTLNLGEKKAKKEMSTRSVYLATFWTCSDPWISWEEMGYPPRSQRVHTQILSGLVVELQHILEQKKKKYPLWGTYSFFKKEESHSSLDSIILWNGGALYWSLQSSTAKNVPIGRSWQHHFPLPGQSKQTLIFHSLNKENTHAELVDYVSNLSHSKELVDGLYRSIFSLKKNLQTVSDLSH